MKTRKIIINKRPIRAIAVKLQHKTLVLLWGSKGFVMCGYLNLAVAERFKDTAVKVVGVSSIDDVMRSTVHSCTSSARNLGIRKGQPIKEALALLT